MARRAKNCCICGKPCPNPDVTHTTKYDRSSARYRGASWTRVAHKECCERFEKEEEARRRAAWEETLDDMEEAYAELGKPFNRADHPYKG